MSAPIIIRLNSLKGASSELYKRIQSELRKPLCMMSLFSEMYSIQDTDTKYLTSLSSYNEGLFYIQNISSTYPVYILSPQPNTKVLDMCAAPGSKTTQMAACMNNTGTIIAADSSKERIYKLKANLARMGVLNTKTVYADGRSLWKTYPEQFDYVLLDAPCSMDQPLPLKKIKELANKQKWLLRSAVSCAKPGGYIVYSTCTSTKEENEEIVAWIESKEKGNIAVVETKKIQRDEIHESFFIAKLHKTRSNVQEFFR